MVIEARTDLANEAVSHGNVQDFGGATAAVQNARIPNYLIVQAIPRIEDMSASDGLWTESVAQAVSMVSDDARAGIDAFFDKRKIEF